MPSHNDPLTETGIVADLRKRAFRHGSALAAVQIPQPAKDAFVVAASPATTYTLTALPYNGTLGSSVNLSLNGLELREGTDYTVDYSTGIVTVSATLKGTPTPADVLTADYWTTGDLIAQTLTPDTGLAIADNFNRANSATTINPASDGGTWSVTTGAVMGISSNKGYTVSIDTGTTGVNGSVGTGFWIAYRDAASNTMTLTLDNTRANTTGAGALFICYDPVSGSNYSWQFDSSSTFGSVARHASDGHPLPSATVNPTAWTGGTSSLRLTHDGAGTVRAQQLSGGTWVTLATITDGFPLTGTRAGFGPNVNSPSSDTWDNLTVTTP